MMDNGRVSASQDSMRHTVFVATLAGPLSRMDAISIVKLTQLAESRDVARTLIDEHARCYVPLASATVMQPLQPNLLGEDYIACHLAGAPIGEYVADWASSVAERVFAVDGRGPSCAGTAFTRLAEAANGGLTSPDIWPLCSAPTLSLLCG